MHQAMFKQFWGQIDLLSIIVRGKLIFKTGVSLKEIFAGNKKHLLNSFVFFVVSTAILIFCSNWYGYEGDDMNIQKLYVRKASKASKVTPAQAIVKVWTSFFKL